MPQPVLNLELSAASKDGVAKRGEETKFDHVMALQEEPVQFKKGHTVAVLKVFLEDEYDLKQEETQLCLDGTILLDPFSLTDFPCVLEASAIDIQVRITCADAKSRK
ncbi:Cytochrome c oxidase assembly protein [Phytophthora nicotianae]|uniref:Cytochrome c oxidase assembly protein n=1 Tax=Phytophthora nicotianae TaxID=4792 RepID=A0A0W8DRB4_PHYNI|nr:Cytochrome c oxidase assembly protein [Phytophthora nicotianae]